MSGHLPTGTLASGDEAGKAAVLGRTFSAVLVSSPGRRASGRCKDFWEEIRGQDLTCKDDVPRRGYARKAGHTFSPLSQERREWNLSGWSQGPACLGRDFFMVPGGISFKGVASA